MKILPKCFSVFIFLMISGCAVKYLTYIEPKGDNLATLQVKNIGEWYVTAIGFAEPNGCLGRTWLGPVLAPGEEFTIKIKPGELYSFQAGSGKSEVTTAGAQLGNKITSVGNSMRFVPKEDAKYQLIVGLLLSKGEGVFSFKEVTPNGFIDIESLKYNKPVTPQWSDSPMCEKFEESEG